MKFTDLLSIVTGIITILAALAAFITYLSSKDPNKKKVIGFGSIVLVGGLIVAFLLLRILTPHQWTQALQEFAPACGDKSWVEPEPGTVATCPGTGLLMYQDDTGKRSRYPAEVDLDNVNGSTYNQTMFKVKVQVKFQATTSDPYTVAQLLVQTPQSGFGGYAFGLNNTGYWELANAENSAKIIDGSMQNFDRNRSVSLEVDVQNNQLTGFINGQQIAQFADSLNPSSGAVSLIVERLNIDVSSPVLFSNFELDL